MIELAVNNSPEEVGRRKGERSRPEGLLKVLAAAIVGAIASELIRMYWPAIIEFAKRLSER